MLTKSNILTVDSVAETFLSALNSEAFVSAMSTTAERLKLDGSTNLVRHGLMQLKVYGAEVTVDSIYFSALSTGFFRVPFTPIPLRQLGIKILMKDMSDARFNEVYVEPVSARDFAEHFENCDRVDFDVDTIGYGIDLDTMRDVIECYYWENRGATVNDSVEIRHNLLTNEKTPYYRYVLTGSGTLNLPVEFTEAEAIAMNSVVDSARDAALEGTMDEVFIYSRKKDSAGNAYVSFYLTGPIR